MEIQPETLSGRALKILSYILLIAGFILISPFMVMAIVKVISIGPLPSSIVVKLFGAGLVAIYSGFVVIPACGIWIHTATGNPTELRRFYKLSFIRYFPVAIIGTIQMIYATRNYAFYITAIYALAVMGYAGWLLWHDRTAEQ